MQVSVSSLGAHDHETTDGEVQRHAKGGRPPDNGVADEVYLVVILHPEVLPVSCGRDPRHVAHDSASHPEPMLRPRVVRMPLRKTRVCPPHDALQLEELRQE